MKRFASILFAIAILLTSGLVQFAVHICPEKGALLSSTACDMHEQVASRDCCKNIHFKETKTDDCCSENYFFAVTAKFGQVVSEKLNSDLLAFTLVMDMPEDVVLPANKSFREISHYRHSKPPLFNRNLLLTKQTLLI